MTGDAACQRAAWQHGRTAARTRSDGDGAGRPRMRYTVDGWDPAYGTSLELEDFLARVQRPRRRRTWSCPPASGMRSTRTRHRPLLRRCCSLTGCAASRPASGSMTTRRTRSGPASDRRNRGAVCLVRGRGGVLLRAAGAPGDGRTPARTVFRGTERRQHHDLGREVHGLPCRRQNGQPCR